LRDVPLFVLLTNTDIFEDKMKKALSIRSAFPNYTGPCEYRECLDFIIGEFNRCNDTYDRKIYFHERNLNDRGLLVGLWDSICQIFENKILYETGYGI